MMLPKIEYIQKRILDILEYQSKKAQGFQKQTQVQEGGKKKRKRSKQSPNSEKRNSVDKCLRCNKEKLIYSKGHCKSCYNYLHRDKEKYLLFLKNWKEKNPNYFKEYYKKTKNVVI